MRSAKRWFWAPLLLGFLSFHQAAGAPDGPTLLIKLRPGRTDAELASALGRIDPGGSRLTWASAGTGWRQVTLSGRADPADAMESLARDASVAAVEREKEARVDGLMPNDLNQAQWFLENIGQAVGGGSGLYDADIDGPEAWELSRGSHDVLVAVLDTGVHAGHPDLAGNLRSGADFVGGTLPGASDDAGMGHGTPVAGIIGAVGDNGTGMAGINWSTGILPLKVCRADGRCPYGAIVAGIEHAVRRGAKVLNLSFTCDEHRDQVTGACGASRPGACRSRALEEALQAAGSAGALVVAAAGNCGEDLDDETTSYPCAYGLSNVLCVGATDTYDGMAWFSNHGRRIVDVAAPGEAIYSVSTSPQTMALWSGTSFAAPIASGVAALQLSRLPGLSPAALVSRLTGGDRRPWLEQAVSGGSRLNAHLAVKDIFLDPAVMGASRERWPSIIGDFDGDGRADACTRARRGGYRVALGGGGALAPDSEWSRLRSLLPEIVGDVNGDGRDDLVLMGRSGAQVMISEATRFASPRAWGGGPGAGAMAADADGDGRDDLVRVDRRGRVTVSLSDGRRFLAPARGADIGSIESWTTADIDADGRADLVWLRRGRLSVARSDGASFGPPQDLGPAGEGRGALLAGDVDGDGDDDVAAVAADGCWYVTRLSDAGGSGPSAPRAWGCQPGHRLSAPALRDADGDGRADLIGTSGRAVMVSLSRP
ncbi:MAG TPA: S8 family serine peptidase [Candidatus Polarisedimenticolia bacterium]|nr:S8 family serine peptidase [Candidatus Polarisedimenticolia bacterium]